METNLNGGCQGLGGEKNGELFFGGYRVLLFHEKVLETYYTTMNVVNTVNSTELYT